MTAATTRLPTKNQTPTQALPGTWKFPMADATDIGVTVPNGPPGQILKGWHVAYRLSDGMAVPFTATTGLGSAGIAQLDQTAATDAGDASILVDGMVCNHLVMSTAGGDGFTNANIPAVAYGVDNATVGAIAAGRSIAGIFLGLDPATLLDPVPRPMIWVGPAAFAVASEMVAKNLAGGAGVVTGTLPVPNGGTGVATATAHGVALFEGASPMGATAVGGTGTVLRGQSGADPIFGAVVLTTDVTGTLPLANLPIQTGTVTLGTGGTVTKGTGITITSQSKVFVSLNTPSGGTQGVKYQCPDASLVVGGPGTGSITVTGVDDAGAAVTTDRSTINFLIIG